MVAIKRVLKKISMKKRRKKATLITEQDRAQISIVEHKQQIKFNEKALARQLKKLNHYTRLENRGRKSYRDQDVELLIKFTNDSIQGLKKDLAKLRASLSTMLYGEKQLDQLKEAYEAMEKMPGKVSFSERKNIFKTFIDAYDAIENMKGNENYDQGVVTAIKSKVAKFMDPYFFNAQRGYQRVKEVYEEVINLEKATRQLDNIEHQSKPDWSSVNKKFEVYQNYLEAVPNVMDLNESNSWVEKLIGKVQLLDEHKYDRVKEKDQRLGALEWEATVLAQDINDRIENLENQKHIYKILMNDGEKPTDSYYAKKSNFLELWINKLKQLDPEKTFLENQESPKKIAAMRALLETYNFNIEMGLGAFNRVGVLLRNINRTQEAAKIVVQYNEFDKYKKPLEELLNNLETTKSDIEARFPSGDIKLLELSRRLDEINYQQADNINDFRLVSWLEKNADSTLDNLQVLIKREQRAINDNAEDVASVEINRYMKHVNFLKDYQPASLQDARKMKKAIQSLAHRVANSILENNISRLERVSNQLGSEKTKGYEFRDQLLMIAEWDSPELLPDYQALFSQLSEKGSLNKRYELDKLLKSVHSAMKKSGALSQKAIPTKVLKEASSKTGHQSFINSLSMFKPKSAKPNINEPTNSERQDNRTKPPGKSK